MGCIPLSNRLRAIPSTCSPNAPPENNAKELNRAEDGSNGFDGLEAAQACGVG